MSAANDDKLDDTSPSSVPEPGIHSRDTVQVHVQQGGPVTKGQARMREGQQFGRYRIVRMLGKGGMGEVYEAEETDSGRRVALKTMNQSLGDENARRRFLREGRLAASISHPNSVYVYGTEEIEGTSVITMELVDGGTLSDRVEQEGPLDPQEAVDAILDVITGLQAATAVGVLHRDIKPSNCFVSKDGTVKVGDYGLSLPIVGGDDTQLTLTRTLLGTPMFASPEQLQGEDLDLRSDIYSVGGTLYHLLTGEYPFEADNLGKLIATVAHKPAVSPHKLQPEIPAEVAKAVLRCLAKDPAKRFQSYSELGGALSPFSTPVLEPASRMRGLAGLVDVMFLLVFLFAWATLDVWVGQFGLLRGAIGRIGAFLAPFLAYLIYYVVTEWMGEASLGKRALGLRVVRVDGTRPTRGQLVLRPLILFGICPGVAVLASSLLYAVSRFILGFEFGDVLSASLAVVFLVTTFGSVAAIEATAKPSNGFALPHDLVTKTRVVALRPKSGPLALPPAEQPQNVDAKGMSGTVGGYELLDELGDLPGTSLFLAFDPVLRRKVWLSEVPEGSAGLPRERQDLARAGRLRWIEGTRSATASWDVYDAPGGESFLDKCQTLQPWTSVRRWLLDVAREVRAAVDDDTLPASVGLDRIWIGSDGRAKLLDFPMRDDPDGDGDTTIADDREGEPQLHRLLSEMAVSALLGKRYTAFEAQQRELGPPIPGQARAFLHLLRSAELSNVPAVLEQLRSVGRVPSAVTRTRRLAATLVPFFFCGVPILILWFDLVPATTVAEFFDETMVAFMAIWTVGASIGLLLSVLSESGVGNNSLAAAGIQMVSHSGAVPSRRQHVLRSIVAWAPVWIYQVAVALQVLIAFQEPAWTGTWLLVGAGLTALGLGWAAVNPEAGLTERVTGTLLIPKTREEDPKQKFDHLLGWGRGDGR